MILGDHAISTAMQREGTRFSRTAGGKSAGSIPPAVQERVSARTKSQRRQTSASGHNHPVWHPVWRPVWSGAVLPHDGRNVTGQTASSGRFLLQRHGWQSSLATPGHAASRPAVSRGSRRSGNRLWLQQPQAAHAGVAIPANDNVVVHHDIQRRCDAHDFPRHADIRRRRRGIA